MLKSMVKDHMLQPALDNTWFLIRKINIHTIEKIKKHVDYFVNTGNLVNSEVYLKRYQY